jgi:integrase
MRSSVATIGDKDPRLPAASDPSDRLDSLSIQTKRWNGTDLHPHSLSQTFERLVKRAGIRTIRLHDLRHTHATLALKAGVPVKVVSERLGHESPAFTLKQYAHVIPGMQAAAAAAVADLIRAEGGAARDAA